MKYRIKFTLSNGKQLYASKRGIPQEVDESAKSRELDFIRNGAYSHDLMLFGSVNFMKSNNRPFLRIVAVEYEDSEKKIDSEAFIQGGQKVGWIK